MFPKRDFEIVRRCAGRLRLLQDALQSGPQCVLTVDHSLRVHLLPLRRAEELQDNEFLPQSSG